MKELLEYIEECKMLNIIPYFVLENGQIIFKGIEREEKNE